MGEIESGEVKMEASQEFVYVRTYARWLEGEGRRELSWGETVDRYLGYLKGRYGAVVSEKVWGKVEKQMKGLGTVGSMRATWTAGEALNENHISAYNCAYLPYVDLRCMAEHLYILMHGTGVGFSTEGRFIEQLPVVAFQTSAGRGVHVVRDSKEGWAEALLVGLEAWYAGEDIEFDYSGVRARGARLKKFGGRASGPEPLKKLLEFVRDVVLKAQGRKLSSLELLDIGNMIGEVVVVGGVRRSAEINFSDLSDAAIRDAKVHPFPVHRYMSNNSAVYAEKPTVVEFMREWTSLAESGSGERGIFNEWAVKQHLEKHAPKRQFVEGMRTNPCFVEGTMVRTSEGHFPIESLVGKTVKIWDGDQWTEVDSFRVTGTDQDIVRIELTDGSYEVMTRYHTVILEDDTRLEAQYVVAGMKLKWSNCPETNETRRSTSNEVSFVCAEGSADKVYCCTVPTTHAFALSNGILYGNCGEIILRPFQFCVAEDTPLITSEGIVEIASKVDQPVKVWNGKKWAEVTVRKTGKNQKLVRVWLSDGSYLDCTPDHRFSARHRFQKEFKEVQAKDLVGGKYALQMEPFEIGALEGTTIENAYSIGFMLGDGCVYKDRVSADLYGAKIACPVVGTRGKTTFKKGYGVESVRVDATGILDTALVGALKYDDISALDVLSHWSRESFLQLMAGWLDADGSQVPTGGVRLYVSGEDRTRKLQLLLSKNGIRSSVCLMQKVGESTNYGERKADIWYLQITDCASLPCHRLDTSKGHAPKFKGKYQTVRKVEPLEGLHDTYCFNEIEEHKAVFANVLTYQCNLSEVVVRADDTFDDLVEKVEVAVWLGTMQAGLTDFKWIRPEWKKNCEEEALLGVSLTGQMDNVSLMSEEKLGILKAYARKVNKKASKAIGINESAAITTGKPSGTVSQLALCGSGAHPWHDQYYLRRYRISATDPVFKMLVQQGFQFVPENGQGPRAVEQKRAAKLAEGWTAEQAAILVPDWSEDQVSTWVVAFPTKAPEGAITRHNMDCITQLEWYLKMARNWCEHNQSITVYVKDEAWFKVGAWVYDHFDELVGVSFLPYDGGIYELAPYETISQEQYEAALKVMPQADWSQLPLYERMDETEGAKTLACTGNACELV